MYRANGYTSCWLGSGHGALIQTPDGALYHVPIRGSAVRLEGDPAAHAKQLANIEQVRGAWRTEPVTDQQRAICKKQGVRCPATQGEAVEKLAHIVARQKVEQLEAQPVGEKKQSVVSPKAVEKSVSEMSDDELIAYIQTHPELVKAA